MQSMAFTGFVIRTLHLIIETFRSFKHHVYVRSGLISTFSVFQLKYRHQLRHGHILLCTCICIGNVCEILSLLCQFYRTYITLLLNAILPKECHYNCDPFVFFIVKLMSLNEVMGLFKTYM